MRECAVLKYNRYTDTFLLSDGQFCTKVNNATASSLNMRHFIIECFRDEQFIQFCANISINYGKYKDEHNKIIGC